MKIVFNNYLYESLEIQKILYHGSKSKFDKFDYNYAYTNNSNASFGPGFYLSPDITKSLGYAYPSGFIYEIELSNTKNIKSIRSRYNLKLFNILMDNIPDKEIVFSNWSDNFNIGERLLRNELLKNKTLYQLVRSFWAEAYRYNEPELLKLLVSLGIDGFLIHTGYYEDYEIVLYNPDIAKFVNTLTYSEAKEESK
jgi:hypothetical protein